MPVRNFGCGYSCSYRILWRELEGISSDDQIQFVLARLDQLASFLQRESVDGSVVDFIDEIAFLNGTILFRDGSRRDFFDVDFAAENDSEILLLFVPT